MTSLLALSRSYGPGGVEKLVPLLLAYPIFASQVLLPGFSHNAQYKMLRMSYSGCIAYLIASVQVTYVTYNGRRQDGRSSAKTGDKALHMQLADRSKLPSSVSFGELPSYAGFTNMQDHSDYD